MPMDDGATLPRSFKRLVWSNLAAQSGEQIALAAAPIVAVLLLGTGVAETGLLQTALTLPFVIFAIPAGLLADRFERRRLMLGAELVRCAALLALLCLVQLELLTWPVLALLGFVAVCGTVAFSVAAPALVSALVARSALSAANARIELARTIAFAAGPALGGLLIGWTGAAFAFAVALLLSGLSALCLALVEEPSRPAARRRHPLREIREGAAFVFRHELLRPVFVTQFVFNTAFFLMLAVFVPYAVHHLGLPASSVGLTLSMLGVGMVVGALSAQRILRQLSFGTVIAIGPFSGLAGAGLIVVTVWLPMPLLANLGFLLLGAGPILWVIATTTLRQTVTPQDLIGRVSAINIMTYGARPLGSALGALIAMVWGAEACLLAAVALFGVQAAVISRSPAVRLRQQPALWHGARAPSRP
jgi:predicted MFS family arabinose efflux permease